MTVRYGVFSRSAQERGVLTSEPVVVVSNPDGSWPYPHNTSRPRTWSRDLAKAQAYADASREFAREHCRRCRAEVELGVLTEWDPERPGHELLCPACAPVSDAEHWGGLKAGIQAHVAEHGVPEHYTPPKENT